MTDHEALEALSKKATQGLLIVPERDAHTDRTSAHINRNEPSVFIACMGKPTDQREADTLFLAALWNAYRTGQLIPAPSVDDAMVERCAIFRQIGRWEMAQEIAFNLETPVKDCTPGAPEQAAFDKAAKLVSMSVGALAGREFCKLPVHVQFHDGEWASIMDEAIAAISTMQVKP